MSKPEGYKKFRTYRKRNEIKNPLLINDISSMVKEFNKKIAVQTKKLGMTKKTLERFLEGEEITVCKNCNTFNRYEAIYIRHKDRSIYICDGCNKLDIVDYKPIS